MSDAHVFECRLVWTGAESGGTAKYEAYSREYRVDFEGKASLHGTAAPMFLGDPTLHNPEDLLVASLCGCHCLTYLALCARSGVAVVGYEDRASGRMAVVDGVLRFTEVKLSPRVVVAPGSDVERARKLHDKAHRGCFIVASVNFPVTNEATVVVREE